MHPPHTAPTPSLDREFKARYTIYATRISAHPPTMRDDTEASIIAQLAVYGMACGTSDSLAQALSRTEQRPRRALCSCPALWRHAGEALG